MMNFNRRMLSLGGAVLYFVIPAISEADVAIDPCGGETAMLNIVDRPTAADSACAVPFTKAVLEAGYQYQNLSVKGHSQNFPEAEFRIGLPAHNEIAFLLGNYIHQSVPPYSGYTASSIVLKHQFGISSSLVTALEGAVVLPDGSAQFGSKHYGGSVNGVMSYNVNSQFNVSFMLGIGSISEPSQSGGQHITSINPDLVLTYALLEKLDLYGEIYGQSKTGSKQHMGFNFDGGLIYLLLHNLTIDIEGGQRISGVLGGFEHYVGAGFGWEF